ncbi:MAG TPA: alpha/beta fold hydrolase [Acidimicrobiia bacterium]|nr:alpha/beta fold hydrolase [Acidimicrobiia bacterium]
MTPPTLPTLTWGSGDRRMLLLHGISASAAGWWRLGADLADLGWEVTAPDLRGHGDAPKAKNYSIREHATDVLALGSRWDAVLGHSMGGAIAVLAASKAPGWTKRLVLQDPALVAREPVEATIDWLLDPYRRPLTSGQMALDHPHWHPSDCETRATALRRAGPDLITSTIKDSSPWNVIEETAALTVPTTIIGSDPACGGIMARTIAGWLADTNPLLNYVLLPGAEHSVHRDDRLYPEYFRIVREALDGMPTLRGGEEERA